MMNKKGMSTLGWIVISIIGMTILIYIAVKTIPFFGELTSGIFG